jgi:aromatic ring-opening dioxygenase LigB subunit
MSKIVFAAISPHPPLIIPTIGSKEDRAFVKDTIESLQNLGKRLTTAKPDEIIISSPHEDWGFNVPLYFLAEKFAGKIDRYLVEMDTPEFYFNEGKKAFGKLEKNKKYALIASGDLSHCLKEDGPYGFNPEGPKFDKDLIRYLKNKDIDNILKLEDDYPGAGECGLRSFAFMLGILEASDINWEMEELSYEGPFGVGYLAAGFKMV